MRKRVEEKPKPKPGEIRIVTKFLFLPKTLPLENSKVLEKRWLEKARIIQECRILPYDGVFWINLNWHESKK